MTKYLITALFFCGVVAGGELDCDLPFGDPACECCSSNWGGDTPPEFAYIVFSDIERTDCDPGWSLLRPPLNRLFRLRLIEELTGNTCAWSYYLDVLGGKSGPDSEIWVIHLDLTAYFSFNVYLANKVDDPPANMIYFFTRGLTDCSTIYGNELNKWDCEPIFHHWAGGTARVFWTNSPDFGEFNGDGVVNFRDYAILARAPSSLDMLQGFVNNWLSQPWYEMLRPG